MARQRLHEGVEQRPTRVLEAQRLQLRGGVRQRRGQQRAQHVQAVQHVPLQGERRSGEKRPQGGLRGLQTRRVAAAHGLKKRPLLAGLRDIRGELAEPAEEARVLAVRRLVRDLGADLRGVGEIEGGEVEQTVDLIVDVENVESMQAGTREKRGNGGTSGDWRIPRIRCRKTEVRIENS